MAEYSVTPQPAMRIGLAAKVLSEFDIHRLTAILIDTAGLPLTLSKLESLEPKDLQHKLGGDVDNADLQRAIACLRGEKGIDSVHDLPQVKPDAQGDLPGSVRVACASNKGEWIDGHFGACERFLVYQVSAQEIRLIDVRTVDSARLGQDKNTYRSGLIRDCDLVYMISIGGPAAAKVVKAGVLPIKLTCETGARQALIKLQQRLAVDPPPWLAKSMGIKTKERVRLQGKADTLSVENEL